MDTVTFQVEEGDAAARLDVFLAARLPQFSRTHLRRAIDAGTVLVDGQRTKVAYKLVVGQIVNVTVPEIQHDTPEPEDIPLDVLFEDEHMVAINKPPLMVVHPAKGHWSGTLTSALAFHFQSLSSVGGPTRPGIVHRLDRDTSGVILVAKTDDAHKNLAAQFEAREVKKKYLAVCRGVPDRDRDRIKQPIGVHPHHRERMAIRANHETSRDAYTEYMVDQRFRGFSILHAFPKTGRTHQIRVHLAHIGCAVACDRLYASHSRLTVQDLDRTKSDATVLLERQALHAASISFHHPASGESQTIEAPIAADVLRLIQALQKYRAV